MVGARSIAKHAYFPFLAPAGLACSCLWGVGTALRPLYTITARPHWGQAVCQCLPRPPVLCCAEWGPASSSTQPPGIGMHQAPDAPHSPGSMWRVSRRTVLSGPGAAGAGVAVVFPGAEANQRLRTEPCTLHVDLGFLCAEGQGQCPAAAQCPPPSPSYRPPSEPDCSESCDESRLSARLRSVPPGLSSCSSRCRRLCCRLRRRSFTRRALTSCSCSRCGTRRAVRFEGERRDADPSPPPAPG